MKPFRFIHFLLGLAATAAGLSLLGDPATSATYSLSRSTTRPLHAHATSASYELHAAIDPLGGLSTVTPYELASGLPLRPNILEAIAPTLSAARLNAPNIEFLVTGTPGSRAAIESSADLRSWNRLQTNSLTAAGAQIIHPASASAAFYRAIAIE
jgi:hypothetical protein